MIGSDNSAGVGRRGADLNFQHKVSIKTISDFKLRSGARPIRHMDVSDAAPMAHTNAIKKSAFSQESQALALASNRNLPPHLLLASLLEELCYIYVKDRSKAQHLFKILCERLIKLQVMAPLSHLDEISGLRYQRRTMLNKIIRAAIKSMDQGPSLLALPDANFSLNLDGSCFKEEDIIEQQTSRYKNEFQELSLLGKGGFGSVFKAKNYLDGREYAVKKVRFKHKNTDLELKLLREVKALANLQHTNIVGYNAAWMEYDNPYLVSRERSQIEASRTQDRDSDSSDSAQSDDQDSRSIEFCLTDDKSQSNEKQSPNIHQIGGFGLAVSAKMFSTVHKQDKVILSGNKKENSRHTHLSESRNSSPERETTHLDGPIQKHLQVVLKPSFGNIETSFVQMKDSETVTFVDKISSCETDYLQCAFDNQKEGDSVVHFEGNITASTEAVSNLTAKTLVVNSSIKHLPAIEHHIPCESCSNQCISECLNSGDGIKVHSKNSTGCVLNKESSDTWTSAVGNIFQAHTHNPACLQCTTAPEIPKNPGFYPIINLPENFTCLCQQAAAPLYSDLDPDHNNHDNLVMSTSSNSPATSSTVKFNSPMPVAQLCDVLDNPSQLQSASLGLPSYPPASLLLLEKPTISPCHNRPSSPASLVTPLPLPEKAPSSVSRLFSSKTDASLQDNKQPSWGFMHNNALSPILSVEQSLNRQHKIQNPTVKMFQPDASINSESFLKSFNTNSTSVEPPHRQSGLRKPNLLVERRSKKVVDEVLESQVYNGVFHNSITLYIQMELCTFTLQEWMFERNTEFQVKGYDDTVMRLDNIRIFLQTLQGVDFIHANGLIHRDLKPRNIFLSGNNLHVKIGDFGLATGDVLKPGREDLVLASLLSTVTPLIIDNHTTGVGTSAYASPEQLRGSNYDFKSDMYSLGVMLYEMFHVFSTEMERVQEIQKLRGENKCSVTFRRKWPLEADTIEALTNPVPRLRPSAQDVLSSQLFLSHEQQVKLLQKKGLQQQKEMERLQKEMERLKKELVEKDKIIARLHRENRDSMMADEFNLFL